MFILISNPSWRHFITTKGHELDRGDARWTALTFAAKEYKVKGDAIKPLFDERSLRDRAISNCAISPERVINGE